MGKKSEDLQTGITIGENAISGTLKYVTGYTGFSSNVAEQSGNYLALQFTSEPKDAVTTVEVVGGKKGPVKLDADKLWVGLISNKDTQSVKVVTKSGSDTITKTFGLKNLTLTAAPSAR